MNENERSRFKKAAREITGSALLDIGCRRGDLREFTQADYTGIDINEPSTPDFNFVRVDIINDTFPFEDNTFDTVTMLEVIEHLGNIEAPLAEIFRVLKPGGKCIITSPNPSSFWYFWAGWSPKHHRELWNCRPRDHVHSFTERNYLNLLARFGFTMVKTERFFNWQGGKLPESRLFGIFAQYNLVVAEK